MRKKLNIDFDEEWGQLFLRSEKALQEEPIELKQMDIEVQGEFWAEAESEEFYKAMFLFSSELDLEEALEGLAQTKHPAKNQKFDIPEYRLEDVSLSEVIQFVWDRWVKPQEE